MIQLLRGLSFRLSSFSFCLYKHIKKGWSQRDRGDRRGVPRTEGVRCETRVDESKVRRRTHGEMNEQTDVMEGEERMNVNDKNEMDKMSEGPTNGGRNQQG